MTLVYDDTVEPDTLNPLITQSPNTGINSAIFDSLFLVDPQGGLQPDLATSADHSPDGRTWSAPVLAAGPTPGDLAPECPRRFRRRPAVPVY